MAETPDKLHRAFDDSPQRFRNRHPEGQFAGASSVLFEQAMAQTRMAICLADPRQEDTPIVFANRAFRELTGYAEEEILGRNCRFLQGPGTDREAVSRVRAAMRNHEVVVVELLNYRRDGTPFWNALHLGPIYDQDGTLIYLFGSQWDVSDVHAARSEEKHARAMARELSHRMKNMFSVIGGIVTVTGRVRGVRAEAAEMNDRIQALGRAYETTLDEASMGTIEIGPAVRAVLAPYDLEGGRIRFGGGELRADPNVVSTLGLTLHELATNAIKYGSLGASGGTVEVAWGREGDELVLSWRESNGPPVRPPRANGGTGLSIIDALLSRARGRLERDWRPEGLEARVRVPAGREP